MMDNDVVLLLLPLIVLQVGLQIFALYDLYQRKAVRSISVVAWALIIVLFMIPGPVAYFVFGRAEDELQEEIS